MRPVICSAGGVPAMVATAACSGEIWHRRRERSAGRRCPAHARADKTPTDAPTGAPEPDAFDRPPVDETDGYVVMEVDVDPASIAGAQDLPETTRSP